MRTVILVLGLVALSVPATAAPLEGCQAGLVCVLEYNYADGDCANGFEYHQTQISIGSAASVTGSSMCYGGGGFGGYERVTSVSTAAGSVGIYEFGYDNPETGSFDGCFVFVYAGPVQQTPNCPVAPPADIPWGNVLP